MKRLLSIALFLLTAAPAAALLVPDSDHRQFLGVIETAEGVDVYWLRQNQLVVPIRSQYFRTSVSHDGRIIETVTVREDVREKTPMYPPDLPAAVATTPRGVLLVFRTPPPYFSSPPLPMHLRIVRMEGDRWIEQPRTFEFPDGDVTAACGGLECVVLSSAHDAIHGIYVDHNGAPSSRTFELAESFVHQAYFSAANELFLLFGNKAALIRRPGDIAWQRDLPQHSSASRAAWNGRHHLIASPHPALHGIAIDRNGDVSQPRTGGTAESLHSPFELVWNGREFILSAIRKVDGHYDSVVVRFNAQLVEETPRIVLPPPGARFDLYTATARDKVVIGWTDPMQLVIYSNGTLSETADLIPPARRRRASH